MQHAGGQELFYYIELTRKFSEKVTRLHFRQLINGLNYIHRKGFVHRDLKPQNIIFTDDFMLKIADFGQSCCKRNQYGDNILTSRHGSKQYMAPQMRKGLQYDGVKCDIFAMGIILFYMHSKIPPFMQSIGDALYQKLQKKDYIGFWRNYQIGSQRQAYSSQFKHLFQRMVAFNPSERPSIQQLTHDPWVLGEVISDEQMKIIFTKKKLVVDQYLQQQKQKQEERRQFAMRNVYRGSRQNRGGDDCDQDLIEAIQLEINLKRELPVFNSVEKHDIVLKEEFPYVICLMKQFLDNLRINIRGSDQDNLDEVDADDLLTLAEIVDDRSNKINLEFKYLYGPEDCKQDKILKIVLNFGKTKDGIILHFDLQDGCSLYYNLVLNEIRKKFSYAIQKITV